MEKLILTVGACSADKRNVIRRHPIWNNSDQKKISKQTRKKSLKPIRPEENCLKTNKNIINGIIKNIMNDKLYHKFTCYLINLLANEKLNWRIEWKNLF